MSISDRIPVFLAVSEVFFRGADRDFAGEARVPTVRTMSMCPDAVSPLDDGRCQSTEPCGRHHAVVA
ncbi:hypothetical protein [Burkholderia pyrrocinia]|uniref:hypothetical protein n=1 Tax=Burkholderia pyrrocinia TaxID=60550 RepID=UPI0030D35038